MSQFHILWAVTLLIEAALFLRLCLSRDPRRYFQALIAADLLAQILQLSADYYGLTGLAARSWYIGIIFQIPLTALALNESHFRPIKGHRTLLNWWVALYVGCAWLRVFPWTGLAVLVFNGVFFSIWLALSL